MIKACIFDFDGLILETEQPLYEAWRQCYEHHGHALELKQYAACVGSDENAFDPKKDLETKHQEVIDWELWDQNRLNYTRECLEGRHALPGVHKRLEEAEELGLICAVASSSPREWVDPRLSKLDLSHHFHSTHCLEDVNKPKPSPELFLLAAKSMGVKPNEALVFEDSLNGLNAAVAAGMPCVVVPSPVTKHLEFDLASLEIRSLDQMTLEEILFALVDDAIGSE